MITYGQSGPLLTLSLFLIFGLTPLIILLLLYGNHAKKKALQKFAENRLLQRLTSAVSRRKQMLKMTLIVVGLFLAVYSFARPQWGSRKEMVRMKGLDIFIAVDTSLSMNATDVKPSRLQKAKGEIEALLDKMRGDRVGLIAFAGTAFVQCPLTVDYGALRIFLNILDTDLIQYPGTALEKAIRTAADSFETGDRKHKVLILMTDGEGHLGDPVKAAEEAAAEGIRIFTIGFGSPQGEPIPIRNERNEVVEYKKDKNNQVVVSKLDETTLEKIALLADGTYYRATTEESELDKIYEELQQMEKREMGSKLFTRREDRYQIFLLLGVLVLSVEAVLTDRKTKGEEWKGRFV